MGLNVKGQGKDRETEESHLLVGSCSEEQAPGATHRHPSRNPPRKVPVNPTRFRNPVVSLAPKMEIRLSRQR